MLHLPICSVNMMSFVSDSRFAEPGFSVWVVTGMIGLERGSHKQSNGIP